MTNGFPPSSPSPQDLAFGWLLAALTRPRSPYSLRRLVSFPSPSPAVRSGAGGGSFGPQKSAGIAAERARGCQPGDLYSHPARPCLRIRRQSFPFPFQTATLLLLLQSRQEAVSGEDGGIASFQTDPNGFTQPGTSRVKVACVCVCVRNVLNKLHVNTSEHLPRPLFQMTPMENSPVVWKGGSPPDLICLNARRGSLRL